MNFVALVGILSMLVYSTLISVAIYNPSSFPKYKLDLILQTFNLSVILLTVLINILFNPDNAKPFYPVLVSLILVVNIIVRSIVLKHTDFLKNMSSFYVRWDSFAVAISTGTVLTTIFYRTFNSKFRYGLLTLVFCILWFFLLPLILTLPKIIMGSNPDDSVMQTSLQMSKEAYEIYKQNYDQEKDQSKRYVFKFFPDTNTIYIGFSGTVTSIGQDVLTDLNIIDETSKVKFRDTPATVHKGFNELYNQVHPSVVSILEEYKPTRVVFCGHSLGGALATLAAAITAVENPDTVVDCYTFGSPQVGDQLFVNTFNENVATSVRVVNPYDLVPYSLSSQFGHVKGGYYVTTISSDIFPASHFIDAYQKGIALSDSQRLYGLFGPSVYIVGAFLVSIFMRYAIIYFKTHRVPS
ncbi:class 3 lipase [Tetraselmis virus 1]|uniref:Class 3 lipase n=1 Tax=Tetraselmis virus 1 TaxID=2060617 RepID=A0A2P0VP29_9VIRU|nr:class 3 lipase [Tetraselmis virus 1]AUF82676.1 class 3 lipase [Tetraselmis virus 1]